MHRGRLAGARRILFVLFFADRVTDNEEGAAWGHGVRDEVVGLAMEAMIGGDVHIVGPVVDHVESRFGLGQEMVPLIIWEIRVSAHENR